MNKEFIQVRDLCLSYRQGDLTVPILDKVHLSLPEGKIGVIIGPSGCGKSTLLSILAGLNRQYRGRVLIDNTPPEEFTGTALILQDYGLLPWKTVWENVILGLRIRKRSKKEIEEKGKYILHKLGLYHLIHRYPMQLSGGQRQRIAIARSLVLNPRLLLMDEPFSSLDALTREEMQQLLLEIWQETKLTILLVTHNIEEAVFLGQEILVMTPLPGTVKEQVTNDLATSAGSRGTPGFLELSNYLRELLYGVMKNAVPSS
ncbi:MAG TPA: ABC transporter ATP-binding protein [Clostridia bacterium]|nr:ABC transporter ATP-binding protein [Clostridia bacterium]